MLDWDAPLSEQPESVRAALKDLGNYPDNMKGSAMYEAIAAMKAEPPFDSTMRNTSHPRHSRAASEALAKAGIPGLKYYDGMSRGRYGVQLKYKGKDYTDEPAEFATKQQADDYLKESVSKGFEAEHVDIGSRNYVTWDQDVLDRTKMLERDGVTLGANKSPTAATAGLLSRSPLEEKATGAIVETSKRGDVLEISKIETPKGSRGQGLAQSKLDEIIAQADNDGMTLALTPSNAFGASKKRLTDWYRRNGFVPNKGQNKNFATRESMVRPPAVLLGNRGLLD
jgi:GNAT superfamily N-acetyltransferase